jgi:hypothetical protein
VRHRLKMSPLPSASGDRRIADMAPFDQGSHPRLLAATRNCPLAVNRAPHAARTRDPVRPQGGALVPGVLGQATAGLVVMFWGSRGRRSVGSVGTRWKYPTMKLGPDSPRRPPVTSSAVRPSTTSADPQVGTGHSDHGSRGRSGDL